ncbi:MAG TPA: response regulator transcription factor [Trueperaceae bacterium]|nr:response regulator transcription factor [Trueperaceae bacterium]
MSAPIRVLVVDDHPVVRDGIRGMLSGASGIEVVGEAPGGAEAVELAASLRPDVVLMDLRMPGVDGVAAIREIVARGLESRVLVLTTYDTDREVLSAIEAGATGYLLKDAPRDELVRAVEATARGQAFLSASVGALLMERVRSPEPEALTERELEVLRLVASGATNRDIAERMFVSEATVKTHLLHVYEKLGVNDRAAAVAAAYDRGLLTPGERR